MATRTGESRLSGAPALDQNRADDLLLGPGAFAMTSRDEWRSHFADRVKMMRARAVAVWAKSRLPVLVGAAVVLFAAGLGWVTDEITIQDERTVYTAECRGGEWLDARCTGHLVAGPRYRFRASKGSAEVSFWTVGDRDRSGRLAPCAVTNGRNWVCKPCPEAARTITLQMMLGQPVVDQTGSTKAFHAVPKWRWWTLRWGLAAVA